MTLAYIIADAPWGPQFPVDRALLVEIQVASDLHRSLDVGTEIVESRP